MITYERRNNVSIKVLLDGKLVGHIKTVEKGYAYFPKGNRCCGETFKTISECKNSLG